MLSIADSNTSGKQLREESLTEVLLSMIMKL